MICSSLSKRALSLSGDNEPVRDELFRTVYRKFPKEIEARRRTDRCNSNPHGSVFNVEFSPNHCNTVLVSHANRALALYDTRLESEVSVVSTAHDDGVNVITFLDSFLFGTGSDDQKIKIWDLRMISNEQSVAVLNGHQGWVKSIEIDSNSNNIFSIAFNDGVRKWDMNKLDSYQVAEDANNLLFELPEGVRMRISPDMSTMVVSLRKNHILTISDFDGNFVDDVSELIPTSYPMSIDAQRKLHTDQACHNKNILSVHALNRPLAGYRTPLSMVCHPSTPGIIAMRVVDINYVYLVQELTLLYNALLSTGSQYQGILETHDNIICSIEESSPDSVIDYIKEIAFSKPDGRVLVSPCGNCVRLLALDEDCSPMDSLSIGSSKEDDDNKLFEEIVVCSEHTNGVLTSRLNSDSLCLVSGCVDGNVVFNWPRL